MAERVITEGQGDRHTQRAGIQGRVAERGENRRDKTVTK